MPGRCGLKYIHAVAMSAWIVIESQSRSISVSLPGITSDLLLILIFLIRSRLSAIAFGNRFQSTRRRGGSIVYAILRHKCYSRNQCSSFSRPRRFPRFRDRGVFTFSRNFHIFADFRGIRHFCSINRRICIFFADMDTFVF